MSPNQFNDIVPPERRSIRNIPTSNVRASRSSVRPIVSATEERSEVQEVIPPQRRSRGFPKYARVFLWGALIVIVALVGLSLLFSGARVVVTPLHKDVRVDGSFTAFRAGEGNGAFEYQLIKSEKTVSSVVPALGESEAKEYASGTIIIFNGYSSTPQRLVKNTRFETSEGLIFRIADSVTVPGERSEGGKTIPGSVEVVVRADEPGEKYNIPLSDFTIPGFKGDPRYESFYARSKTLMTGGFVGVRPSVDEATLKEATDKLQAEVRKTLADEAMAQKPEGFYLYDSMIFVDVAPPSVTPSGSEAQVSVTGTLYGVLFNKESFAALLAAELVPGYDGETVRLSDETELSIKPEAGEAERPFDAPSLNFTASGNARIIWVFSEEQLKQDLAGRPKEALPTILSGYGSIDEARAIFRPFWKQSFPETPGDIEVEVNLPE